MGVGYPPMAEATMGMLLVETSTNLSPDDFIKLELALNIERAMMRRRRQLRLRSSKTSSAAPSPSSVTTTQKDLNDNKSYSVKIMISEDQQNVHVLEAKLVSGVALQEAINVKVESYHVDVAGELKVYVTLKSLN
jgi:hypothetical protein